MAVTKSILLSALVASATPVVSSKSVIPEFDSPATDLSEFLNRIVGGDEAELGDYPYYASMGGCGGTLISPDAVLTAAHCRGAGRNNVVVGAYQFNMTEKAITATEGAYFRTCSEWIPIPTYQDGNDFDNDYALCRLNQTVDIDQSKIKLELNFNDAIPLTGDPLTAIGLGTTEYQGSRSEFLQHVDVPYIDNDVCDNVYGQTIRDNMICAGLDEGGKDSCQGDSGGPLVSKVDNGDGTETHKLMGVVSFGYRCAWPGAPGVYARVSSAETWIKQQVCADWGLDASFCPPTTAAPTDTPTAAPTTGSDPVTATPTATPTAAPTTNQHDEDEDDQEDKDACVDRDFAWGAKQKPCKKFVRTKGKNWEKKLKRKCNKDYGEDGEKVYDYCKVNCGLIGLGSCPSSSS